MFQILCNLVIKSEEKKLQIKIINIKQVNNEFYIAPVYNEFIKDNKTLIPFYVHKMWGIGTPEDLKNYLSTK